MRKTKPEVILNYIKQFRDFGPEIVNLFSNGMCWQFSIILRDRFGYYNPIAYDPVANHFALWIDDRIYDITGDITDDPQYKFVFWDTYKFQDTKEMQRIYRDCILKIPNQYHLCYNCDHSFFDEWGTMICDIDNEPVDPDVPCEKGDQSNE